MCLIDTIDGALMMTLYTSTSLARDIVAILYYSIVLTAITVLVAICIGTIQVLSLIAGVANPTGKFWDGVNNIGNDFDIIGGSICGLFVVCGIASVILYRPWRRWVDKNRNIASIEGTELEVQDMDMDGKALDGKRFGTTEETRGIVEEAELECPV
jgi:high-affinity nickel-transport protein